MTHDRICPNYQHYDGCLCCEVSAPCIYCRVIAKAEQRVLAEQLAGHEIAYEQGQRDAIDAAVQRVEALPDLLDAGFTYSDLLHRTYVIAAIKGDHT